MMAWRPPTLRDARPDTQRVVDRAAAAGVAPDPEVAALLATARDATLENPLVTCGCGRRQSADMMRDLRGADASVRAVFDGRAFVCDACCEQARLRGRLSLVALARALGAPEAHAAALEENEKRARDPLLPNLIP